MVIALPGYYSGSAPTRSSAWFFTDEYPQCLTEVCQWLIAYNQLVQSASITGPLEQWLRQSGRFYEPRPAHFGPAS